MFDLMKIQSEAVFNIDEFLKNSGQDVVLVGLEGHGLGRPQWDKAVYIPRNSLALGDFILPPKEAPPGRFLFPMVYLPMYL